LLGAGHFDILFLVGWRGETRKGKREGRGGWLEQSQQCRVCNRRARSCMAIEVLHDQ
jgi:hypothetical protein